MTTTTAPLRVTPGDSASPAVLAVDDRVRVLVRAAGGRVARADLLPPIPRLPLGATDHRMLRYEVESPWGERHGLTVSSERVASTSASHVVRRGAKSLEDFVAWTLGARRDGRVESTLKLRNDVVVRALLALRRLGPVTEDATGLGPDAPDWLPAAASLIVREDGLESPLPPAGVASLVVVVEALADGLPLEWALRRLDPAGAYR